MSNEIQTIGEMTKVLIDYTKKNHISASTAILTDYAEQLYNAGYRKQSGWISVDERLPEFDERVLVYLDSKRSCVNIDTDRIVRGRGVRWGNDITHWMPLPEAPKMKGGE